MKNIFLYIFLISFSIDMAGQSSEEFRVDFDKDCFLKRNATSQSFEVDIPENTPFTFLSAYILEPDLDVNLSYRLRGDGDWTEWQNLDENHEGETPDRTTFKAPVIEQDFLEVQFRSSDSLKEEVVFRLYFPASSEKKSPDEARLSLADSSCNCVQPAVCGRSCWCPSGNCPKDSTPSYTLPTHVIIHHSAGGNTVTDYPALVSSYWNYHVNTNGWDDIGYNWLIDPNGVVYEGRGDSVEGAHFSCMNSETIGICLIGNFQETAPSAAALSSLSYFIAWESCDKEIVPWASSLHESSQLVLPNISAHRDANNATVQHGCPSGTVCPGVNLYALLPLIRADVSNNPCLGYLHQEEAYATGDLEVYPVPAKDILKIETSGKIIGTKLINSHGQVVRETKGHVKSMEVSDLSKGAYLLQITLEDEVQTKRVVLD